MAESIKFSNIESSVVDIFTLILQNQNIRRYLKYMDNEPLSVSKSDITDTLVNENIFLKPYSDVLISTDAAECYLFAGNLFGTVNQYPTAPINIKFIICCPNDYWVLEGKGKLRAFRIADEISKLIDSNHETGAGRVEITNFSVTPLNNNKYSALDFDVQFNTSTKKPRGNGYVG